MGDLELAAIAARQHSLVTRHQAREHLSRKQVEYRLTSGRLQPVRHGVYRFAGSTESRWQDVMAACLAAGAGAVASHRTAAELWSMPGVVAEQIDVLVTWPNWPRVPGVAAHQTTLLPDCHRTRRFDIPVTTPARTLVDLSSTLPKSLLARIVDDACRRRVATLAEVREVVSQLSGPGRRGLANITTVLAERGHGFHPGDSDAELDIVRVLVHAGLPRPVQQHQVPVGRTVYLLDAAYPDLLIDIEYKSWSFHGNRSAFEHDAVRDNRLRLAGWTVLDFTSASSTEEIVETVEAARAAALARGLRESAPSAVNLRETGGSEVAG